MAAEPFTLTCYDCDAGSEYECAEAAVLAGWGKVAKDDPEGWTTHIGLCPDCREQRKIDDAEEAERIRKNKREERQRNRAEKKRP